MAFALVYRIEFINFEENTVRIDLQSGNVPTTTGNTLSVPTNIAFSNSGGFIEILYYATSFFYVGMSFTVAGSVSNDGSYTVTSLTGSVGGPLTIFVPQTMVDEYVGIGPVVFTDNSTTDPQIIPLQGTGTPLVISTINNDQDKFQPIRSKQAVIQFISDSSVPADISTFSTGPDNKWIVDISIIGVTPFLFRGFLIMADNQQPFQPDPQTVQLTATDHLGALKDVDLLDFAGNNPKGCYRIADLIMMCLRRTGVILDLYVVNNLRTGSGQTVELALFSSANVFETPLTDFFYVGQRFTISGTTSNDGTYTVGQTTVALGVLFILVVEGGLTVEAIISTTFTDEASSSHFYDVVRLDAKTFEKEIGVSEDCYTVLTKILGKDCYVCEWAGAWWIQRVDEFNEFSIYAAHFDNSGVYVGIDSGGAAYNISVGAAETRRFANADTLLQFIRPHGKAILGYPFNLPLEIPDNIDFERGELTTDVSAVEKHYSLDDWVFLYNDAPNYPPTTTGITYLQKNFFNGDEIKRFLVINPDPLSHWNLIMSNTIPVNKLDKFHVDLSQRIDINPGGSGVYTINIIQVRLYGVDGTFWTCQGRNDVTDLVPIWVQCTVDFDTNQKFFQMVGNFSSTDFLEAQNLFDGNSAEIPVDGYLRILVYANPGNVSVHTTYIDNVTFDYIPYINGSYKKYSSYTNSIERLTSGYMAKVDEPVYCEDGPNRLTKGAWQIIGSFTEILSDNLDFVGPQSILIPGNVTSQIYDGQLIRITGTTSNNGTYLVTNVTYHTIPDNTEVTVLETIVTESSAAGVSVGNMALTRNWYSSQPLALALNTDPDNIHSYGYIQIYSVWNQFRGSDNAQGEGMGINIFTGSILGLTTDWPDLLHKFLLTDTNSQTNDRYFMLLSMSQDWKSCIWTFTMAEVFNTVVGRNYLDTETFKYIAE